MSLDLTPGNFLRYEIENRALGTTAASEYLSNWTTTVPTGSALSSDLVRVALVNPPSSVTAEVVASSTEALTLRVHAQTAGEVALAQFYFPGWQGFVDGIATPLRPCAQTGLICLTVPASDHEVQIRFMPTPIRRLATGITLLALIVTIVATVRMAPRPHAWAGEALKPNWAGAWSLTAVVVVLLGLKVLWVEPSTTLFRLSSPPDLALPAQHKADLLVGDRVKLLGYDVDRDTVTQGEELHVRLYWQALAQMDTPYSAFVQLLAEPGHTALAGSDSQHPGNIPTTTWSGARYVVDDHIIHIPTDMPPVAFRLYVGMYEVEADNRVGEQELPHLIHVLPRHPVQPGQISQRVVARFGEQIRLLGYAATLQQGVLALTLYWQSASPPAKDYQVFVHVVDDNHTVLAQQDSPPMNGQYPSSTWLPGQIVVDERRIPLRAGVRPAGVFVGLYELATMTRLPATGENSQRWADDAMVLPLDTGPSQ